MDHIDEFTQAISKVEQNMSEMIKSISENTFGTVAMVFDGNRLYLIELS